jgi:hypothetical protein
MMTIPPGEIMRQVHIADASLDETEILISDNRMLRSWGYRRLFLVLLAIFQRLLPHHATSMTITSGGTLILGIWK